MAVVDINKIKKLREDKNLSQKEMAKVIGCSTLHSYYRKEKGKQPFLANEIFLLAKFFGQKVENFFEVSVAKNAINNKSKLHG
ncbi:helix-turn-helix transcriptional regulator [Alkalicoccobacillus porphyridii]|uniref:Helix-turn-helix transcriptional regulator n=1 Tax=Alkalicoccobacillus porphyridii TaxID=2597270 RepID=A0A554A0C9_9BACI|nr:helix-turn-helix transcriptional regulator [Alkalicoccobacillus porphyridii]TSB47152.1 helix-turn-helix transcriptional regulator [Alkalicoccobacillus porphyridii]